MSSQKLLENPTTQKGLEDFFQKLSDSTRTVLCEIVNEGVTFAANTPSVDLVGRVEAEAVNAKSAKDKSDNVRG